MKGFFITFLLCIAQIVYAQVEDSIVMEINNIVKGIRLFPITTTDSMKRIAEELNTYLCLDLGDTLLIISNNEKIFLNDTLTTFKNINEAEYIYNNKCKKAHFRFFSIFDDPIIVGYNSHDTLIFWNSWEPEEPEDTENYFFLANGEINGHHFNYGKLYNGMKQKELFDILSIQNYIHNEYRYIIFVSPYWIKKMWFFDYKENQFTREKVYMPIVLSFKRGKLIRIRLKDSIIGGSTNFIEEDFSFLPNFFFK